MCSWMWGIVWWVDETESNQHVVGLIVTALWQTAEQRVMTVSSLSVLVVSWLTAGRAQQFVWHRLAPYLSVDHATSRSIIKIVRFSLNFKVSLTKARVCDYWLTLFSYLSVNMYIISSTITILVATHKNRKKNKNVQSFTNYKIYNADITLMKKLNIFVLFILLPCLLGE